MFLTPNQLLMAVHNMQKKQVATHKEDELRNKNAHLVDEQQSLFHMLS